MIKTIAFLVYKQTWSLALFWTIIVLLLTLMVDYSSCLKYASWIENVFAFSMIIFTLQAIIIIIFTYYQKTIIDKNLKEGKDSLIGIDMLNEPSYDGKTYVGGPANKLYILPLYIVAIYSISKIIIVTVKGSPSIHSNDFVYMIWIALLIFSGGLWFILKKYTDKKDWYSIKYTLIVIALTLLSIFWEYTVPYIVDIVEISKCVFAKMLALQAQS